MTSCWFLIALGEYAGDDPVALASTGIFAVVDPLSASPVKVTRLELPFVALAIGRSWRRSVGS